MSDKIKIDGKSLFWDMAVEAYRVKLWMDFGKSIQEFLIALVIFSVVLLVWLFGAACFLIGLLDPRNIVRAYRWGKDVIREWRNTYERRYSKRARDRRRRDLIRNTPKAGYCSREDDYTFLPLDGIENVTFEDDFFSSERIREIVGKR